MRLAGLLVVAQGEGAVRRAGRAVIKGGLCTVLGTIASKAAARSGGGIFSPELEAAFYAKGGNEIWIDCGWEPLEL